MCNLSWTPHSNLEKDNSLKTTPVLAQRWAVWSILTKSKNYELSTPGGSGVAEWARALTGDRTVNGSSPAAVKTFRFASELWQFRLPRLASVFRMRH